MDVAAGNSEGSVVTADVGPNAELADMRRRFWISAALTLPVVALGMLDVVLGHSVGALPMSARNWLEQALATPVVLWCGWPLLERGWKSIVTRRLNMFTLIGIGVATAYLYSVVATMAPGIFPEGTRFA